MTYLALKNLHILGVVLFLGNIVVTGWWKLMADRTRDPRVIAFAVRQVILTDRVFTSGGAVILLAAGTAALWAAGLDPWQWLLGLLMEVLE